MKTRREARAWLYRHCVAHSLRRKAALLKPKDISPDATAAHVKRVQAEMLRLAAWLEAKADKLQPAKTVNDLL